MILHIRLNGRGALLKLGDLERLQRHVSELPSDYRLMVEAGRGIVAAVNPLTGEEIPFNWREIIQGDRLELPAPSRPDDLCRRA